MDKNDASLLHGIRVFAVTAGAVFLLGLPLMLAGSDRVFAVIAFFCPWVVVEYGNSGTLTLAASACCIGLLAGFLAWLRRTLDELRGSYEHTISELKTRVETLEKKLNTMTKD